MRKEIVIKNFVAAAFVALVSLGTSVEANAQELLYYRDAKNGDMLRHTYRQEAQRSEIILPQVNGYNVYKADLHTHTIYSDGNVTPKYRVREAWTDGLDIMACTEHVEYRPYEGKMLSYLKGYVPTDNKGILVDLNFSNRETQAEAVSYGITIIPGVEITRKPETIGHYNALFVEDANTIYDADAAQSIRNARKQGALILHNHPGWRRKSLEMTEFEKVVYGEGLVDGVEVMNGAEFYPSVVGRASENKLFVSANTDLHGTAAMEYGSIGHHRNMTFIFAKECTLEAIKEALKERRTLAYSFGTVAGEEQLIKDFFNASVSFEIVSTDSKGTRYIRMTNKTSINYVLRFGKGNPVPLRSFSSRNVKLAAGKDTVSFVVENMWIPGEKHPEFEVKF